MYLGVQKEIASFCHIFCGCQVQELRPPTRFRDISAQYIHHVQLYTIKMVIEL